MRPIMLNKNITIKSVAELQKMQFRIPCYQRGYRWKKQQVEELLDDILHFMESEMSKSSPDNSYYCLQPLVVKQYITNDYIPKIQDIVSQSAANGIEIQRKLEQLYEENCYWEVIDGQQRLTTLFLILKILIHKYSCEYNLYSITYETRNNSKSFIESISQESKDKSNSNIDYYYIFNAYQTISEWIENKVNEKSIDISQFYTTVYKELQFIWYETDEDNPIEVFTRLNIGKISLTNAELIKAALLAHSNFADMTDDSLIHLKQQQIATKWDEMEYALQNDELWLFLNDNKYKETIRIDFLFQIIRENNILGLNETEINNVGNDQYSVYRYFAQKIKSEAEDRPFIAKCIDSIWSEVTFLFDTLIEWFHDKTLYHYMGFLFWTLENDKKAYSERRKKLNEWYIEWRNTDKKSFLDKIKNEIKHYINCSSEQLNSLDFNNDKNRIRGILLLHNIQTILMQQEIQEDKYKQTVFYKFPFHLFKKESWNVEHIDSATQNDLDDSKDRKAWLQTALAAIKQIAPKEAEVFLDKREQYLQYHKDDSNKQEKFSELYKYVQKLFSTDNALSATEEDNERMHIWNLALLDESTNKSYQNSIFSVKRAFIILKEQGKHCYIDSNGEIATDERRTMAFVPICTKQAFMKYYTPNANALLIWTKDDANHYLNNIKILLKDFLK